MGLIGKVVGVGRAAETVGGVAEVLIGNRAEREQADLERKVKTLEEFQREFDEEPQGRFDRFVAALNRLPRPVLSIGTISLFLYAMADPAGFSERMAGLQLVPQPLWWLMGAIVSFYFGARELHHYRAYRKFGLRNSAGVALATDSKDKQAECETAPTPFLGTIFQRFSFGSTGMEPAVEVRVRDPNFNAAVEEWKLRHR